MAMTKKSAWLRTTVFFRSVWNIPILRTFHKNTPNLVMIVWWRCWRRCSQQRLHWNAGKSLALFMSVRKKELEVTSRKPVKFILKMSNIFSNSKVIIKKQSQKIHSEFDKRFPLSSKKNQCNLLPEVSQMFKKIFNAF